ncbi:putative acyl-coa dehydrogenase ibr3 [Quercus suber]|uniref:Acyl-coa dehydrogenase ibr3 n=1 Tax=Quercus suber TaxID=58331 RepID=A0AAW0KBD4_QUESU
MASRTSEMVAKVSPAHALDHKALLAYASANVPGFPLHPSDFTVSQFGHGQSNPTYLMEVRSSMGDSVKRYVLRKKPPGKLLHSAHAVDREFQVLRALGTHTQVPVPKAFCLCTDPSVIGTAFYIMEYLDGRIFVDPTLPGVSPDKRRAIYQATANTLASLHSTNVDAMGLTKYGRLDNYCKRQVERWATQYIASTAEGKPERNPKMIELANWLRQHIPHEDSSGATSGLVHGDFRIDNLVFHPNEDRVIGILDWELSTLGNQMCDVAYSCLHYIVSIGLGDGQQGEGMELAGIPEGVPSLAEYLAEYCYAAIRSGFAMTEPQVASSDATNIECSIKREGDTYVINGTKWWTSGAMDPRCKVLIVMGKTDFNAAKHKQQSMIIVDTHTPGVRIKRPLMVFGFDDAPHGHAEVSFVNVRVPAKNILLGEGRGFEIAQGRLGPGRLHHCMRLIGAAERGMQMMAQRALSRRVFGKLIAEQGSFISDIAKCRIELEKARLLVLEAADQLDRLGNKKARGIIAMAKVAAPNMALKVLDMAMQVHGGAGLSSDTVLAHLWVTARTLRIADGPDEVHLGTIGKLELQRARL